MSGKQSTNFPDALEKLSGDGDKCGVHDSSTIDSGFISSGNLSEDIVSTEFKRPNSPESKTDSKKLTIGTESDFLSRTDYHKFTATPTELDSGIIEDEKEDDDMRLDSSCLVKSISNLNIQSGLNDLSCSKTPKIIVKESPVESKSEIDDKPWKIYYEQDEDGDTYLHLAIRQGLVELTLALIRVAFHPRLLDTPNDDAQTPLHLAVESGQWHVVRWLRIAGARPCPRDLNGDSPLHLATRNGDLNCIKAITDPILNHERDAFGLSYSPPQIYQTYDLDQWNYVGQTCVHVAAMQGHVDIMKQLVQRGADVNAREGLEGLTALHYAVQRRDEVMVHYLLTECSTLNPQVTTYGGRNALQINPILPPAILDALRMQGLDSPYSSDEEFTSDSSDDEVDYQERPIYNLHNLVNASA